MGNLVTCPKCGNKFVNPPMAPVKPPEPKPIKITDTELKMARAANCAVLCYPNFKLDQLINPAYEPLLAYLDRKNFIVEIGLQDNNMVDPNVPGFKEVPGGSYTWKGMFAVPYDFQALWIRKDFLSDFDLKAFLKDKPEIKIFE